MKITIISYKIASWTLLLGGIIHTLSDLLSPSTPERDEIVLQMKAFTGSILGTQFNLFGFFQGFSFMMGLFLFGYGTLNVLLLKNNASQPIPSNILICNIIISFVGVMLSINYFFLIPVLLTGIPFLGFLTSFVTKKYVID
jgi:hypothetical protein